MFQKIMSLFSGKNQNDEILKTEMILRIKNTIEKWNCNDIYAISLWVSDIDDETWKPTFTLGYNTEAQYQKEREKASSDKEARWNFAFWLQNEELVFGDGETSHFTKDWIVKSGYPYFDDDSDIEDNDWDAFEKITQSFINILIRVVQELHKDGFIRQKFKKDLPIIIHELEYYEKIADQNIKANSREFLDADFIQFCHGIYE